MPHPSRPTIWTDRNKRLLADILNEHDDDLTLADAARIMCKRGVQVSATSVGRQMRNPGWRATRHATRPVLTETNRTKRKDWASKHKKDDFKCDVDIDEKWFYGHSLTGILHVPPNTHPPRHTVVNKSFMPKVMHGAHGCGQTSARPQFRRQNWHVANRRGL